MNSSRIPRLILGSLMASIVGLLALSAWLIGWPLWKHHQAVEVLSALTERTDYLDIERAANYLANNGESDKAIAILRNGLKNEDVQVRRRSVYALGFVGPPAASVLVAAYQDGNVGVRLDAVLALERLGTKCEVVLPSLLQAVVDSDHNVRLNASLALARLGPRAKSVVPDLVRLLDDPRFQIGAARALIEIDPSIDISEKIPKERIYSELSGTTLRNSTTAATSSLAKPAPKERLK